MGVAGVSIAAMSVVVGMRATAEPVTPPPVSRLNVEQLIENLDRQDVAGAIRLVEQGWKDQYENYYQGKLTTTLLEASAISQRLQTIFRLTGKRSALVYAIPTPNHLELILVPPGGQPVHRRVTVANRDTLLSAVKAFRTQVMDVTSSRATYLASARRLYQLLMAPLEQDLKANRIDTLIFCLGGGLRTTPLAALHDGDRFLIEKYNLAIIPAFNLLDHRPMSFKGAKVLAMGASEFAEQLPLPAVPLELKTIANNLWTGDVLLNQRFTVTNLRTYRTRQTYRIVHLATHADFAPGSVANSYIQFWDQRVSPNRFQELSLRYPEVQLLVLSACRTAVGNLQAELGFAGLAVMSGSRAAIASLWHVSDVGTLALMTDFYRQLKTMNKTEALRQAQIAMLTRQTRWQDNLALRGRPDPQLAELGIPQTANFSHPYYWSAFTVVGNAW
ncbi:MAG: CHAT domain-containing protein [Leptolyngbyaceae cyanobacterium bins.349]|nr:CHAT domain-containing protein [Leptolyngbyaceae cyanobacterium bins.349]